MFGLKVNKTIKSIISMLLAMLMVFSYFPMMGSAEEAHADGTSPITVDYVDSSGNNQVTNTIKKIGSVNGNCIPYFDEDEWAYLYDDRAVSGSGNVYLVTLPENSTIKAVHFSEYDLDSARISHYVYSTMFNCFRDVSYSVEFNGSTDGMEDAESEDAYLFDSDFIGVSERSIESSYGNSYPCYQDYSGFMTLDEEIPVSGVKGLIFSADNRTDRRDVVIVQIAITQSLDKSGISSLIETVPTSGYHSTNDTWNGKTKSDIGFWAELQLLKEELQAIYESSTYSQAQIDAKVEEYTPKVEAAIAALIPTTQVLPVKIHNALETIKLPDDATDKYSTASIEKFNTARDAAQAAYDTLFDSEGNAITDESIEKRNTADRQDEIDAVADALKAAYDDLLGKSSEKDIARWVEAGEWVSGQEISEDEYTEETVSAFNTAVGKINEISESVEDVNDILASKSKYEEFTSAVADALASYYGLESNGDIKVHVRVVDNYGLMKPEYAIADQDTATFDGDMTLSENKTVQGLFTEGGLNTAPKTAYPEAKIGAGAGDEAEHPHTFVYVNGKLVIPTGSLSLDSKYKTNPSAGHRDIYSGNDTNGEDITEHYPVLKEKLRNGDDIVVLRTRAPYFKYYQAGTMPSCISHANSLHDVPIAAYIDSFGLFDIEGEDIKSVPGEEVSLSVVLGSNDIVLGDKASSEEAQGVSLFVSEGMNSEEEARKATLLTELTKDSEKVTTDEDGKAKLTFDKEGWYKVSVMDMSDPLEAGTSYLDPGYSGGKYPYVIAGDSILINVTLDDERQEVADAIKAAEDAKKEANDAKAIADESKKAAEEAAKTPGAAAVEAAKKAEADALEAQKKAEGAKEAADTAKTKADALAAKASQMNEENAAKAAKDAKDAADAVSNAETAKQAADTAASDAKKAVDSAEKAKKAKEDADKAEAKAKKVTNVTVNVKTVNAKAVNKAITKAGGKYKYIKKITLGKKVKKISKKAFAKCKKAKTLVVKTKKLKKKTVKGSLKGSKITKVQVKVGSKKVNKKFVKKYKKIFTKKICGKKVSVK